MPFQSAVPELLTGDESLKVRLIRDKLLKRETLRWQGRATVRLHFSMPNVPSDGGTDLRVTLNLTYCYSRVLYYTFYYG